MSVLARSRSMIGGVASAALIATMGAVAAVPATAATQPLPEGLEIIEGHGIGDLIGLGQSRESVIETLNALGANNGNCNTADTCSFRLSGDTASITLGFTSGDQVDYITVVQGGIALDKRWETTAGVVDGTNATDVAALYPSSTLTQDNDGWHVIVDDQGDTYNWGGGCYGTSCTFRTSHNLYVPAGQQLPDGSGLGLTYDGSDATTPELRGMFVVFNEDRKSGAATLEITVTDPDGKVSTYTRSV